MRLEVLSSILAIIFGLICVVSLLLLSLCIVYIKIVTPLRFFLNRNKHFCISLGSVENCIS